MSQAAERGLAAPIRTDERSTILELEPLADSSQIPTILVSRLARQDVTVSLSGDGGDEVFGGYVGYFCGRRLWNRIGRIPTGAHTLAGRALTTLSPQSSNAVMAGIARFGNRRQSHNKMAEVLSVPSADVLYHGLAWLWSNPESIVLDSQELPTVMTDPSQHASLDDFTHRMMYFDAMTYLPDDILVKVDRASMWSALKHGCRFWTTESLSMLAVSHYR